MAADLVTQNPFAAVTFIGAPAILTNAANILALTTSSRVMRCLDRIRELSGLAEKAASAGDRPATDHWLGQMERMRRQSMLFLRALRLTYLSMACFAGATVLALVGAALLPVLPRWFLESCGVSSLSAGVIGISGLTWAASCLVRATRYSMMNIEDDIAATRRRLAEQKRFLPVGQA